MITPSYSFQFVECYADDPELSRTKGWVSGTLSVDDRAVYSLYFVTPYRLSQDAASEFERGKPFYAEPNSILVEEVERAVILRAVQDIVTGGYTDNLCVD